VIRCCSSIGPAALLLLAGTLPAQEKPVLPQEPVLRFDAGGPTAVVTALAFAPDGRTLYTAGYDKVVRAWARDPAGRFTPKAVYRVPLGPGADGALNALAVSPDGRWLAAAGLGVVREAAGFTNSGILEPRRGRLSRDMLEDEGRVHLFDTATGAKRAALRGHRGPVC
jgi:WD40 repeat protein